MNEEFDHLQILNTQKTNFIENKDNLENIFWRQAQMSKFV